ncbi:hypothetical protein [Actinoallomurus soli]|uniref:hypothetical protein n=1 Tax=Actinoallomurus soli TaxID=2952535 RepID=UPI002093EE3D|nr:hypothetical protein [Actinoallomurus soli]MCO5972859.1 hypothetical protein [Actinoallomurus soli]
MAEGFTFPMRAGAPSGTPGEYNSRKDIDDLLKKTAPDDVKAAGQNYQDFASAYEKVTTDLVTVRGMLHEAWGGTDAAAAQSALREIWASSATIQRSAQEFGSAINDYGSNLDWYQKRPPSKDLAEARSWMAGANERVYQAWAGMPSDVSTTLPPNNSLYEPSPTTGAKRIGETAGGSPAGNPVADGRAPGVGGHAPKIRSGASEGSSHVPGSGHPVSGADGSNTQLAGSPAPDPRTEMPGGRTGLLPNAPGSPGMPGAGIDAPPRGVIGGLLPGGPGVISPANGPWGGVGSRRAVSDAAASAAEEAQAAETRAASQAAEMRAASQAGVVGPAGGAAGDRRDRERERTTWLTEDEDVWTGGIEAGSHLIGAREAKDESASAGDEAPELVQIDLSSDSDDLDQLLYELSLEDSGEDPQEEIARLRAKVEQLENPTNREQGQVGAVGKDSPWYFEEDV